MLLYIMLADDFPESSVVVGAEVVVLRTVGMEGHVTTSSFGWQQPKCPRI